MNRHKILLISFNFLPHKGGSRVYYYNIYKRIQRNHVVILTHKTEGYQEFDKTHNLVIYRTNLYFDRFKNEKLKEFLKFAKVTLFSIFLFFRKGISEFHCGEPLPSGFVAYLFKILFGVPYLVYVHGEELTILSSNAKNEFKLVTHVLKNANMVVAACSFAENRLKKMGIKEDKIIKVLPGVDERFTDDSLVNQQSVDKLKKDLGIEKEKIVLTIGRLTERKGHEKVMLAFPNVLEKIPDAVYLIVGKGRCEDRLRKIAEELHISEHVKFLGEVTDADLPKYYAIADVFIMLNLVLANGDVEGFGMVFMEASAFGKPLIGGKSGGTEDSIVDGITGFRVDPNDTQQVSGKIIELLSDEVLARKLGEAGRKRAKDEFLWQDRADQIFKLLK